MAIDIDQMKLSNTAMLTTNKLRGETEKMDFIFFYLYFINGVGADRMVTGISMLSDSMKTLIFTSDGI